MKKEIVIYGAQGMALGAYEAVSKLCPDREIPCFLVTSKGNNADLLAGVPVLELAKFVQTLSQEEKDQKEVLIATPENVMPEIENCLQMYGLRHYTRLDSLRWAELMGYYYVREGRFMPLRALPIGTVEAKIRMYMAKFYKDKPLTSSFGMPDWIVPIQVGAALCEERVADLIDCEGEHISYKNVNYSELTALYWLWKNVLVAQEKQGEEQYFGLCHYRRILDLSEEDCLRLSDNNVDVVLPYPMPYDPDIEEHHKRYLKDVDWQALHTALKELAPEYADIFPNVLKQTYFYNYNIMLARKEVLFDYCEWLFPILERIEELSVPKGKDRSDRYVGYMGETLATLYFMVNCDKFKIVHAGCRFLV